MRMGSFLNWRNPMAICSLPLQQLQPAHTAFVHFWQQGKEDFQARLSRKASWVHTPSSLSWTWQRHELAGTHDTLPCLWRCCALLLSFLMLLWSDNISKYPVLEGKFLQKTWSIFPRCSTRGCFNYTHLHMLKHATYVVCVGRTHACHTSAFSLATYDMGVWLDF